MEHLRLEAIYLQNELLSAQRANLMEHGFGKSIIDDMEVLKKEYFFALTLNVKLSLSATGHTANFNVHKLYDEARSISFTKWSTWLQNKLVK